MKKKLMKVLDLVFIFVICGCTNVIICGCTNTGKDVIIFAQDTDTQIIDTTGGNDTATSEDTSEDTASTDSATANDSTDTGNDNTDTSADTDNENTDSEDAGDTQTAGTDSENDIDTDNNTDSAFTDTESDNTQATHDGVDILIVLDNSVSMEQEQVILGTAFYTLINTLISPPEHWPYVAVNNIRVAVISTDMAFSAGGVPYVHDTAQVKWPHPVGGLANCWDRPMGDGAVFKEYVPGDQVTINAGIIQCNTPDQCPDSWNCNNNNCQPPDGGVNQVDCPELKEAFVETNLQEINADLAMQTACLTNLGTMGCGIEQQLAAGAAAFSDANEIQRTQFIKESHLLTYLIVSDEEDCSLKDPAARDAFFESPDIDNIKRVNVACGSQSTDWLASIETLKSIYTQYKASPDSVIFAGIVGVPEGNVCERDGTNLASCLELPKMQYVEFEDISFWKFESACVRPGFTVATPGRRYVQLATEFGDNGLIFSICNPDWRPAMEALAEKIAKKM